jgi:predicted outer membrane protein
VAGDPVGDTIDEGRANGDSIAAQAFGELSADDELTLIGKTGAILGSLDDGEIQQSSFAIQILGADDIFEFANDMIADHESDRTDLDETMRFYGAPFIPSQADAQLNADAQAALSDLRATPPSDFDLAYVEVQVKMHASAQVVLDQLADLVGPGVMGDQIANTHAMVDDHMDRATALLDSFY